MQNIYAYCRYLNLNRVKFLINLKSQRKQIRISTTTDTVATFYL